MRRASSRVHHMIVSSPLKKSRFFSANLVKYSSHRIESVINTTSDEYENNMKRNTKLAEDLRTACQRDSFGPQSAAFEKHKKTGKLPVDQRIIKVLDKGSSFLELSQLAGYQLYRKTPPGSTSEIQWENCRRGGIVTGIGTVNGGLCMIIANDYSVKGGSYFPITVKKHLRAQRIAMESRIPVIYLVDSAGANLLLQAELFPDEHHFGKIFYNQARMSAMTIPQLAVVLGSCTAGAAYLPCMCDENIINKKGTIFLGGPQLVAAATGDQVDAFELGGAEVHSRISGVTDFRATDESNALQLAREVSARWNTPKARVKKIADCAPLYPPSRIYGIISDMSSKTVKPFDVREILACLLDRSEFTEFKKEYDENLVCGFGSIYGIEIGIIANNGVLLSESALKGTHFVQLCCSRKRPILFIQNITGFMIGKKYEREGIAKHGAKMVHAISNVAVPKITLVIGGSYGAGNYAMCGRAFGPRFLFTWPGSRTAVMSGDMASKVMANVAGKKQLDVEKFTESIQKKYDTESHSFYGSARLWNDGVIDPLETRNIIGLAFEACLNAPIEDTAHGVFRM